MARADKKQFTRGVVNGYVYILPELERPLKGIKKCFGRGLFWSTDWSSFGLSIQVLKHGFLFQLGPTYLGWVHIQKQREHWDLPTPPSNDAKGI